MLSKMKVKTLPGKLLWALVLWAIAAVLLWYSGFGILNVIRGPQNLDDIPVGELEGKYVTTEISAMMDWYAETVRTDKYNNEKTSSREYIIPVGAQEFMGVEVKSGDIDTAETIMDDTWDYLDDKTDHLGDTTLQVTGVVRRMDTQTQGFYEEVVGYDDMDAGDKALFLPLVLVSGSVGKMDRGTTIAMTLAAAVLCIAGLVVIVRALAGSYQKQIRRFIKASADPQATEEQLNRFYEDTPAFNRVRLDDDFLLYEKGPDSFVIKADQIAWVYQTTTQHRTNGIPTGKTYGVTVCDNTKRRYTIPGHGEAGAKEILDYLYQRLSGVVFGYSDQLNRLYNQNPTAFADTVLAQRNVTSEAAATVASTIGTDGTSYTVESVSSERKLESGTYGVYLEDAGENKLEIIKVIKDTTGRGLRDVKEMVDSAPVSVLSGVSQEVAEKLCAELVANGAKARVQ